MARIWHLQRTVEVDYQEASAMVVVADNEKQARAIASRAHGGEGAATWLADQLTSCTVLGSADPAIKPKLICLDYLEG